MSKNSKKNNVVDLNAYRAERENNEIGDHWVWRKPDMNDPNHIKFMEELESIHRGGGVPELSDAEINKVMYLAIEHAGEEGISEDTMIKIIRNLHDTIINYNVLCLAINGMVSLSWDEESDDLYISLRNKK